MDHSQFIKSSFYMCDNWNKSIIYSKIILLSFSFILFFNLFEIIKYDNYNKMEEVIFILVKG